MSSIMKGLVDENNGERVSVVYIDGKPGTKHVNAKDADDAVKIMRAKHPNKKYEIKPEIRESPETEPQYGMKGGGGTYSLPNLQRKAIAEAEQLVKELTAGKFIASATYVQQLANTIETLADIHRDLASKRKQGNFNVKEDDDAALLKRITARKYGGNDRHSWAVFVDGKPMFTGLGQAEIAHCKKLALRKIKGEPKLAYEGFADSSRSGIQYITKNKRGQEKAFKSSYDAENWKNDDTPPKVKEPTYAQLMRKWDREEKEENRATDARLASELASLMISAAGEYFPDGDPTDAILEFLETEFGREWSRSSTEHKRAENVKRAALKQFNQMVGGRYKSYVDYLADFWDDVAADNPEAVQGQETNPWRSPKAKPRRRMKETVPAFGDGNEGEGGRTYRPKPAGLISTKESSIMKGLRR